MAILYFSQGFLAMQNGKFNITTVYILKAVADAYKIMGKRNFYAQIMEEEHTHQKFKVTDWMDVVTMKDYMQYCSHMDETPARSGGRDNPWRKLTLSNVPKTMMMYDIINYAESGILSSRLQKEMKYLLQKPRSEAMRQHQLHMVSKVRCPAIATIRPFYQPSQQQSEVKHLGRRSKQAKTKVEKMKKNYMMHREEKTSSKEPQADTSITKQKNFILHTPTFKFVSYKGATTPSQWEDNERELFAWYQDVFINHSSLF